jgi:hypothetical protein
MDTDRRIQFMEDFTEHEATKRRDRIRREVELAYQERGNGDTRRYDMLCWGAALRLERATQEQRDAQKDLIAALLEAERNERENERAAS